VCRWSLQRGPDVRFLQLGVAERGPNIAMTEKALDDLDALALCDELTAARAAELMRCVTRDSCFIKQPGGVAQLGPLIMQRVV
jgi:hypothetical protein